MSSTKAYKGVAMEGIIASWYAKATVKDLTRHQDMARQIAARLQPGAHVLEIAPGPGYFCIELARLGDFQITGLDISRSFVDIARKNASEAGVQVDFRLGNASALSFEDGRFDLTFCQAAFKNFSEPVRAIAEMYRVLRPHGSALIVDLRRDATQEEIQREIDKMGLGPVDKLITKWTFQQMLLKSAYNISAMESMIAQTPFGEGRIDIGNVGFQVTLEK